MVEHFSYILLIDVYLNNNSEYFSLKLFSELRVRNGDYFIA